MKNKKQYKELCQTMQNWDLKKWDQKNGTYEGDNVPCCVGAKLAWELEQSVSYINGAKAFCELIGANYAQIIVMLKNAGAGDNPFGASKWPEDPHEVFKNLEKIEKLPSLEGADLRFMALRGAKLKWANLKNSDLEDADLRYSNLRNTDLSGANLRGARLKNADLGGANLEGADLSGADLTCADLSWARLEGAVLEAADLEAASVQGTILENKEE